MAKKAYRLAVIFLNLLLVLPIFISAAFVGYRYGIMPDVVRQLSFHTTFAQYTQKTENDYFTKIILKKYPVGTETEALKARLKASGFDYVDEKSAHFTLMGLPCRYDWHIEWQQEAQTITSIHGSTSSACL